MKPEVKLSGEDGNAFSIMARVNRAMIKVQRDNPEYDAEAEFAKYQEEANKGDYDHLIQTTMKMCTVS